MPEPSAHAMVGDGKTSVSDAEIAQGAQQLALELRRFVPDNALPDTKNVADLQLAICRKLREVSIGWMDGWMDGGWIMSGRHAVIIISINVERIRIFSIYSHKKFLFLPPLICVFLSTTAASHQPRIVTHSPRAQLDSHHVNVVKSTRSTSRASRSAFGADEYCRIVCSTILLSTYGATNVGRSSRCPSRRFGRQGDNPFLERCHGSRQ